MKRRGDIAFGLLIKFALHLKLLNKYPKSTKLRKQQQQQNPTTDCLHHTDLTLGSNLHQSNLLKMILKCLLEMSSQN